MSDDLERYLYHSHQGWPVYETQTPSSLTGEAMTHDMQRYEGPSIPRDQGSYVLASDAEAAIAAAEKRGYDSGLVKSLTIADCYESGQDHMLAECIQKVSLYLHEEVCSDTCRGYCAALDDAISALRGLTRKEKP